MNNTFFLDTDEGSIECKIITSLYSEKYKQFYLVYEETDKIDGDVFVSKYDPKDEENNLFDVSEKELKEVMTLLEDEFADE